MKQAYLILAALTFSRACSRSAKLKQASLCPRLNAALMCLCFCGGLPVGKNVEIRV